MSMMDRAKAASDRTNKKLAAREKELLSKADIDWDALLPKLPDPAEREAVRRAVAEASRNNETVGDVIMRLSKVSADGLALAERVRKLLP